MANHALTPERAAIDHRISAGVAQIFQYHGTTFGQVLLQERPQQAHLLIIASGQKGKTNLGEVAMLDGHAEHDACTDCLESRRSLSTRDHN
jgi:hypothetical protein